MSDLTHLFIPSQPRARRSSSIFTSSMHRKMVVNCSTWDDGMAPKKMVGLSLGVGFNVDSTFTVSYALVLGGVVVDMYIYITPYSYRGCIPVYGGYNHLLCPFITSTATPATRQRLCHVCCLEIFIQREQVGNWRDVVDAVDASCCAKLFRTWVKICVITPKMGY